MENTTIYQGIVSFFSYKRHFGYIDSDLKRNIYFFFDPKQLRHKNKAQRKEIRHIFYPGDKVSFKIEPSRKPGVQFDACEVELISSPRSAEIAKHKSFAEEFEGILRTKYGEYFVENTISKLLIPVKVCSYEIMQDEVYYDRINKTVKYNLKKRSEDDICGYALLVDRKFDGEKIKRSRRFNTHFTNKNPA